MIQVKIEPMVGNKAGGSIGDKSGLWKLVIYNFGTNSIIDRNSAGTTHADNLTYEQAFAQKSSLEKKLNDA